MSGIQEKFLSAAMENQETMEQNADAMNGDGGSEQGGGLNGTESSRGDFLNAQSEYQANMQMFNMAATATSTTLKSLGEGLKALASKM